MEINKGELLSAMQTTLYEYEIGMHRIDITSCSLCCVYIDDHNYECNDCPMFVFTKTSTYTYPCMKRKCVPVKCFRDLYSTKKELIKLLNVKEFYERAIKRVESMSEEELNVENAFEFLIEIDKEVFEKHKL